MYIGSVKPGGQVCEGLMSGRSGRRWVWRMGSCVGTGGG